MTELIADNKIIRRVGRKLLSNANGSDCCCGGQGWLYQKCPGQLDHITAPTTLCLSTNHPFITVSIAGNNGVCYQNVGNCADPAVLGIGPFPENCDDPICSPTCTNPVPCTPILNQTSVVFQQRITIQDNTPSGCLGCGSNGGCPVEPITVTWVLSWSGDNICNQPGPVAGLFGNNVVPPTLICSCPPPSNAGIYWCRTLNASRFYSCDFFGAGPGWYVWVETSGIRLLGFPDPSVAGGVALFDLGGNPAPFVQQSLIWHKPGFASSSPAGQYQLVVATHNPPPNEPQDFQDPFGPDTCSGSWSIQSEIILEQAIVIA